MPNIGCRAGLQIEHLETSVLVRGAKLVGVIQYVHNHDGGATESKEVLTHMLLRDPGRVEQFSDELVDIVPLCAQGATRTATVLVLLRVIVQPVAHWHY